MSRKDVVKRYKAVQIAFCKDSERLLQTYSELETFSYKEFAKIWQNMSFSLVYAGKSSFCEYRHFTEVFLFEAKKYFIYSKNIYLKTASFYLMYGLYYKQPIKNFVKIRLIKDEFKQILEYIDEMKSQQQSEPLYCYVKMMVEDVFDFVYHQTVVAPDLKHFIESFVMCDNTFEKDLADSIEKPLLKLIENKDIAQVNADYKKALNEYISVNKDSNLMVFENNILDDIKHILNESRDNKNIPECSNTETEIGRTREVIKAKAQQFHKLET